MAFLQIDRPARIATPFQPKALLLRLRAALRGLSLGQRPSAEALLDALNRREAARRSVDSLLR